MQLRGLKAYTYIWSHSYLERIPDPAAGGMDTIATGRRLTGMYEWTVLAASHRMADACFWQHVNIYPDAELWIVDINPGPNHLVLEWNN